MRFAPRYDVRVLDLVRALDDPTEPMAETCRRVGAAGEKLGLTRPSYVHLRRLIIVERELAAAAEERRAEMRRLLADVGNDLLRGHIPNPWWVERRLDRIRR